MSHLSHSITLGEAVAVDETAGVRGGVALAVAEASKRIIENVLFVVDSLVDSLTSETHH